MDCFNLLDYRAKSAESLSSQDLGLYSINPWILIGKDHDEIEVAGNSDFLLCSRIGADGLRRATE